MAQSKTPGLTKRGGSVWHFNILVEGQRYQGSTRTTDLKTATLFLGQLRLDIARGKLGLKGIRTPLLLEEIHKEFLAYKVASASPSYLASVSAHWRIWLAPRLGQIPINKIKCAHVDHLRNSLLEAGRSRTYTNNVLTTLRTLLNFAKKREKVLQPPRVELLRLQRKPRPTIPVKRFKEFLAAVDGSTRNPHVGIMVRVMLGLGCRSSEVLGMRWEWLDQEQRTYTVGRAKGKEARVVPVPSWLWESLLAMPKTMLSEWIFPAKNGKPHCPQLLQKPLKVAAESLGLGHVTQHRLRASFATLHAETGTPISEIQAMLGHKNIQTTMIYVETSMEGKRKAQDTLSEKLGYA
jgi:integrase